MIPALVFTAICIATSALFYALVYFGSEEWEYKKMDKRIAARIKAKRENE